MKVITKIVLALCLFFCIVGAPGGPKAPSRTSSAYSDSTGGTPPDTLQQPIRRLNKKKIRKIRPVPMPIRNDSTGGTPPDTLKMAPK